MIRILFFIAGALCLSYCQPQSEKQKISEIQNQPVLPGAYQIDQYLPQLKGKKLGLCVNHTSLIEGTHLVDTLQSLQLQIARIYTPEHGYRGTADAGQKVANDTIDQLEVISLYGSNKKPTKEQLSGIDLMIFDLQDVGTRFYTYISTMHYIMEACAAIDIPVLILDRPNPNDFIDGPMLDTGFRSFVGMHPIPAVHGLTVGELAQMINGEGWLANGIQAQIDIIPVQNWKHGQFYQLPVKPSPNLPNQTAVYWYPTLCFFEGTKYSIGRGTAFPFQVVGSPEHPETSFSFTPISGPGAKYPKLENELCNGIDLRDSVPKRQIDLTLITDIYQKSDTGSFFTSYFNTLAGTDQFQQQIQALTSPEEIRNSWQASLNQYKIIRNKYLIYQDYQN